MAKITSSLPSGVFTVPKHNSLQGLNEGDYQHLTVAEKASLATITYVDGKIEDVIVDGVTTKAPSQNSVFDALLLKENLSNKVTVLANDITNIKYPTVNAVITGDNNTLNSANNYTDSIQYTRISATNKTGSVIPGGSVVYISGAQGSNATIALALADTNDTTSQAIGITVLDINNNASGYVYTDGLVTELNTNAFNEGTTLYLSATIPGGLTTTPPTSPNQVVFIGTCIYQHAIHGKILVDIQHTYRLDHLKDVDISTATTNQVLFKDTDGFWRARTINGVFEVISNKQNSLAIDGSGTKYPTVDAINSALSTFTIPDATTTIKGKIKLAGDLSGTADSPTVPGLANKIDKNSPIVGATNTKITYDSDGLVVGSSSATTADINDSTDRRYVTDADYIDISNLSGINTGDERYTNSNPTYTVNLGIPSGTTFSNQTMKQMWDALLYPELFPTLTNPSNTFTTNASAFYEVGTVVASIAFSATFDRGSISPAYGTSGFRSGLPTTYVYTGTGLTNTSTTALSDNKTVLNYNVPQGITSWTGTVTYSIGDQPLSNKGNPFNSPLPAGTLSPVITRSTEGVYPLFGTTSTITTLTKQSLVSMISANNVQMTLVAETGGNKQKFEIPVAWTTSRPLLGVLQLNTVSNQYEYPGGSQATSLAIWTTSSVTETIQSSTINYTRYTYNGSDRGSVTIRLVF